MPIHSLINIGSVEKRPTTDLLAAELVVLEALSTILVEYRGALQEKNLSTLGLSPGDALIHVSSSAPFDEHHAA